MGAEWVPLAAVLAYCGMIACDPVCARFCSLRCPCVGAVRELLGELLLAVRVWVGSRCFVDCLSAFGLGVAALSIVCPCLGVAVPQ